MVWAILIGIFGGVCTILALRWHDARVKEHTSSEVDEFEIIEDF